MLLVLAGNVSMALYPLSRVSLITPVCSLQLVFLPPQTPHKSAFFLDPNFLLHPIACSTAGLVITKTKPMRNVPFALKGKK